MAFPIQNKQLYLSSVIKKKNIVTIDDMQYVYLTIIDNMTNLKYMVKHKIKDVTQLMTLLEISS